ncbi:hypothetical protein F5148DRAFT_1290289 [Russula earlei]|uniref:Uncharacterized protein n=1 Tax=Russula earlei TaxID=71964 RepID=A0ACC0TW48_9AGAM|nr:hypothetical protein F5148DRAFT_1290289 [Russula earlei]
MKTTALGLYILLSILLLAACHSPVKQESEHPGYLDSVVRQSRVHISDSAHYFSVLEKGYHNLDKPGMNDLWDKYYLQWNYFYAFKKDYIAASRYADSMLDLSHGRGKNIAYPGTYAKTLLLKGNISFAQRQYSDAFNWYFEARKIIRMIGDTCSLAAYNNALALVTYNQKKYREAADYYKKVTIETISCRNNRPFSRFINVQGALDNIGICYTRLGMMDSAAIYYDSTLQYINTHEQEFPKQHDFITTARAIVWGNQADVALYKGNDTAAERLLLQSIYITEQVHRAPEDAAISRVKLLRLYNRQSRPGMIKPLLDTLTRFMDTLHSPTNASLTLFVNFYEARAAYFSAIGKGAEAYASMAKASIFKDSLAAVSLSMPSEDIKEEFENISRKTQLALLKQENQSQRNWLLLATIGLIMGITIILLSYRHSRQSRKHVQTLTHLNDDLQQTLSALEKSQQDNSRLMKIVVHDLRNPIGAITSTLSLIIDGKIKPDDQQEALQLMYTAGNTALTLVTDLLHLQPGEKSLAVETVNIQALLQYCITLLQHKASEKQQTIHLKSVRAFVNADREQLWRVFSNLIGNAIKFSHTGTEINIRLSVSQPWALVEIEDHGIGIPDDLQNKIFDLPQDAKRKGTAEESSYGLGLLISRQIIETHKGIIGFTSKAGEGSTFYVKLPVNLFPEASV